MISKYIHVIIDHNNNVLGAFYSAYNAHKEVTRHLKEDYKEYEEKYVDPTLTKYFSKGKLVRKIEMIILK